MSRTLCRAIRGKVFLKRLLHCTPLAHAARKLNFEIIQKLIDIHKIERVNKEIDTKNDCVFIFLTLSHDKLGKDLCMMGQLSVTIFP